MAFLVLVLTHRPNVSELTFPFPIYQRLSLACSSGLVENYKSNDYCNVQRRDGMVYGGCDFGRHDQYSVRNFRSQGKIYDEGCRECGGY